MLLAEAIREKDYIEESITSLEKYILVFMAVHDKTEVRTNKTLIEGRLDELKELYKKYQQFSVTIERAKARASIKVNDTTLSLLDATAIKNAMNLKLESYEALLDAAAAKNEKDKIVVCIDMDELFKYIENIKIDIKTLESEMNYAHWNIEV
jgi:uncharacterized protein YqgV (UPF0045/DUF77 family)